MPRTKFEKDDLVWAKMKGFPYWPAEIISPPEGSTIKKNCQYVRFFTSDTRNCAWISDELIKKHGAEMFSSLPKKISKDFQFAIDQIIDLAFKRPVKPPTKDTKIEVDNCGSPIASTSTAKHPFIADVKTELKSESDDFSTPSTSSSKVAKTKGRRIGNVKVKSETESERFESDVCSPLLSRRGVKRTKSTKTKRGRKKPPCEDVKVETESDEDYTLLLSNSEVKRSKAKAAKARRDKKALKPASGGSKKVKAVLPPTKKRRKSTQIESNPPVSYLRRQCSLNGKAFRSTPALKIGVIGLGRIGCALVRNFRERGLDITVWNRTREKYDQFFYQGVKLAENAGDLVQLCDIVFSCLSDDNAVSSVVFSGQGILQGLRYQRRTNVGYVEMTSIRCEFSKHLSEAITAAGARYLEAPLLGTRQQADEGLLFQICAGDQSLFYEAITCFHAICRDVIYLDDAVGSASHLRAIFCGHMSNVFAALAESLHFCERNNLPQEMLLKILKAKELISPTLLGKAEMMIEKRYTPVSIPLKHFQKDAYIAIAEGNRQNMPIPVSQPANAIFLRAKRLGYGEHDAAAVYQGVKYC